MKKLMCVNVIVCGCLVAASVFAAPGEYWEIASKMEMAGMPFAMPETTTQVCIPTGSENDPRVAASGKDDNCVMTDVKTVGNTTTWKMRCDNNGEIMTGVGEITHTGSSYQGKTHLAGKMEGEMVNMDQSYRGKKIGGACDTEALHPLAAQAKKQIEESCNLADYSDAQLAYSADLFLGQAPICGEHKDQYCAKIRANISRSKEIYNGLVQVDGQRTPATKVATLCTIDMETARQTLCTTYSSDYSFLEPNCPAQAKAYMEAQRQKELSEQNTGRASTSRPPAQSGGAGTVLDSAKKLKGIFGL